MSIRDSPAFDLLPLCPGWHPSSPAQAADYGLEGFMWLSLACVGLASVLPTPGEFRTLFPIILLFLLFAPLNPVPIRLQTQLHQSSMVGHLFFFFFS